MNLLAYAGAGVALTILLGAAVAVTGLFVFSGADHSRYDSHAHPLTEKRAAESDEHAALREEILAEQSNPRPRLSNRELITIMRKKLDERGAAMKINARVLPVTADGVDAEWVLAPNADPDRRILYLHGGAYVMGSAQSHRFMTGRLSEISQSAVLAVNYRLMPEHSRMAGIEDCRKAYSWLIDNGPNGPALVRALLVAGDSSGGNLALSTIAYARDAGLRAAEAAVVMSPQTDATLSSPSLRSNVATDVMQGQSFGPIVQAPRLFSLWFSFLFTTGGINPRDPVVSPLLGDLAKLPPTLIQVSRAEMFLDDSVRYANKAKSQDSTVVLQTWPFALHVWQAFDVPEADEAYDEIERFLAEHVAP
ncbi:MAG: alpha/beta hydrolase [Leptospirales bacterium]